MITGVIDFNTDFGRGRTMDPDMAPGYSLGPDVTVPPPSPGGEDDSTGHADLYGPSS